MAVIFETVVNPFHFSVEIELRERLREILLARRFGIRKRQEYDEFNRLSYYSTARTTASPDAPAMDIEMISDDDDDVVQIPPEKSKPAS